MIKIYKALFIVFVLNLFSENLFSQTTLIGGATNNGNFEAVAITPWAIANNPNTNTTNRWVVNTGIALNGLKSAYITNVAANTYAYSNNQARTQHIYQQVTFPAGESCINLSFNWRYNGEGTIVSGNDWDNLKVYVSSTLPTGGTNNANVDRVGLTWYNLQNTTQTANITLPAALAGTTRYLIFQFKCDGSGGAQAPAAIDNVVLTTSLPPAPACASYISPSNNSSVCPVSQLLSWNAVATPTCGSITYDVYFNAGATATTLVSPGQAGTTYATGALIVGTTYSWKIVPKNGTVTATSCSTFSFTAGSITSSSVAPFTNNFETCSDWTIVNGAQINKWFQGTATSNGGTQSMYVSDNGGTTNTYDNTSTSVTHFYKDISFPAGQSCITLTFDWKGDGQNNQDYLQVFAIATSSTPVAGTEVSSGALTADLQNSTTWQTTSITIPSAYAGTTQRLVFSWRNNGSNGNNPPAAVDNIIITTSVPPTPSCSTYNSPANSSTVCNAGQTLSWNALSTPSCGAIVYDVYFNAGTTATTLASNGQAGTTYATGALTNGTTYAWRIVPRNGTVSASSCSTFTFLAVSNPTPSCVTPIYPADGSNVCTNAQTLSWDAITSSGCGAITYDVYFNAGSTATTIVSTGQVGTTYVTPALTAGTSYAWKVVVKSGTTTATSCSDYFFTSISGQLNDLPCNATNVTLGTIASGDNNCASATGDPTAAPGCWTAGTVNSVWYSFTAPSTGNVKIRTAPGTLLNTQIAVYSGACGTGMTLLSCNQNAPNCGLNTILLSEVSLTGLTNGATYYVMVDGENSLVGTFGIAIIESSSSYPLTSGQICSSPNPVCNSITQIGDPGNQGVGLTCDDTGGNNCTGGERGSVWYTINTAAAGNLNFLIIPNDYNAASPGSETDYDFVLWKISGSGATNCSLIASSGGNNVSACNYSGYGVTGVSAGGNAPAGYDPVYDGAFEPTVTTAAGETYVLLIENYSNSTKGFMLDLSSSDAGVISYSSPTTVIWTGGANTTNWASSTNWGGCSTPTCGLDAIVSSISTYQPLVTAAMGTVTVNNLTIDPGAVLNLGANAVLKICGNLTNNGAILSNPTSTILFSDNATHTLNGTLSGSSKIGNLVITDAAGGANCRVIANTNIEIKNNFTTSNSTSVFDLNGKDFLIGGDFINSAGANTFSNTAGSTITFNGSGTQTYNPNANAATPTLTLNNVIANHVGTGITLSTTNTPNMIIGTSGVLTLTAGKIITPNSQEVVVMNTALAAVSTGNTSSYVEGNLRRYLVAGATGLFDFPVGHATPGYERASVDFKTAAAVGAIQLVARFDSWGGTWPQPAIPNWSECSTTYNLNYLNHGYWSIDASSTSTGSYDLTLYNRSYTNATGAGYSIAKSPSSAPSWTLNGNCVISPATSVQRANMSGFSKMSTVQGSAPLPVELVSFSGVSEGTYNSVNWKSAIEVNFKHYELESAEDGINFSKITTVNPIGNMSSLNNYNYLDFNIYSPITYYRLKMVDLDYTFEYSPIISIENGANKIKTIIVYPNPASSELFIKLVAPLEKEALVNIKDIYGRIVYEENINLNQTIDNTYINTSEFASGTYIVSIIAGNSISENVKVIINNKQ